MGTINTSMQAVQQTQVDLTQIDDLPPLGNDMVSGLWGGQAREDPLSKINPGLGLLFFLHIQGLSAALLCFRMLSCL